MSLKEKSCYWNISFSLLDFYPFSLQHSYGFIQCCDRQARLFFHFSQFDGNIEHLKIGDPVEFEMTYDRRTGKPIASSVSKIAPEVVSCHNLTFLNDTTMYICWSVMCRFPLKVQDSYCSVQNVQDKLLAFNFVLGLPAPR